MRTGFLTFALMSFVVTAAIAQVAGVDWKFYGGNIFDGVSTFCFYNAKDVKTNPDGNLTFWDKCSSTKQMNAIDIKKDFGGDIVHNAVGKMLGGYEPPYAKYKRMSKEQTTDVTILEEKANIAEVQPKGQAEWELNCEQRRVRFLVLKLFQDGRYKSGRGPTEWSDIPPESNAAALATMLCPAK